MFRGISDEPYDGPTVRVCTMCGTAMDNEEHHGQPTQLVNLATVHNYNKKNLYGSEGYCGRNESTRAGRDKVYHASLRITWEPKTPEERVEERAHQLLGIPSEHMSYGGDAID